MSTKLTLKQFRELQSRKNAKGKPKTQPMPKRTVPLGRASSTRTVGPKVNGKAAPSDGRVRFTHREFAFDVVSSSTSFSVNRFIPINPGNDELCTWLGPESEGFESYDFESLEIEYKPLLPATSSGGVYVAIDYDASDAQPLNKADMMSYQGAERHSVWEEFTCRCDRKDLKKLPQRFILGDVPPTGTDVRLFNVGNLIIATDGIASAGLTVGEIYVKYDVWLITPQKKTSGSGSLALNSSNAATNPFTDQTALSIIGNIISLIPGNTTDFVIGEVGRFIMDASDVFSSTATALQPVITAIDAMNTVSDSDSGVQFVNSSRFGKWSKVINVLKAPARFTMNYAGVGTGSLTNQFYRIARYVTGTA